MRSYAFVKAIQVAANDCGADLKVDGKLGLRTSTSLDKGLFFSDQFQEALAREAGKPYSWSPTGYVSLVEMKLIVADVSRVTNVSAETLFIFLDIECPRKKVSGETYYKTNARNGSHRGVLQLSSDAWKEAKKLDATTTGLMIDKYQKGVFDPRQCVAAGANYILVNRKYATDTYGYTGPYSPSVDYALYNQGFTFIDVATRGSALKYPGQSRTALLAIAHARDEILAGTPESTDIDEPDVPSEPVEITPRYEKGELINA